MNELARTFYLEVFLKEAQRTGYMSEKWTRTGDPLKGTRGFLHDKDLYQRTVTICNTMAESFIEAETKLKGE